MICHEQRYLKDFPGDSAGKNPPANAGDMSSIPGSGRSPGEGHGISLQYSCLENSIDRGAWWVIVHGIAKSWTELRYQTTTKIKKQQQQQQQKTLKREREHRVNP